MRVLSAGAFYFAVTFVAAFAFGTLRTLVLEPRLGETWAVACEAPFLLAVMIVAARIVVPRVKPSTESAALLGVGAVGLVLQEIAELALIYASGETVADHIAYLQTPAGMIYLAMLVVFLLTPLVLFRGKKL